jgi:hypothetical protein
MHLKTREGSPMSNVYQSLAGCHILRSRIT